MTITHDNDLAELEKEMRRNAELRKRLDTALITIDELVVYNDKADITIRAMTDAALRQSAQWEAERAALLAEIAELRGGKFTSIEQKG